MIQSVTRVVDKPLRDVRTADNDQLSQTCITIYYNRELLLATDIFVLSSLI